MQRSLAIAIADDEPRMRQFFRKALERLGHQVVGEAATGPELIELCETEAVDLIITDIQMPGMDGLDAISVLSKERPLPVILVSAYHDDQYIDRAKQNQVLAYLIKPITDTDLQPAITIAMERFKEFQTLRNEANSLKNALEDRKIIERAKGIVMKRTGLQEPDAFRRLQKIASNKSIKLVEVARMIVTAEEAIDVSD
jgi:AmiR/NasT family two-component response regulator